MQYKRKMQYDLTKVHIKTGGEKINWGNLSNTNDSIKTTNVVSKVSPAPISRKAALKFIHIIIQYNLATIEWRQHLQYKWLHWNSDELWNYTNGCKCYWVNSWKLVRHMFEHSTETFVWNIWVEIILMSSSCNYVPGLICQRLHPQ